MRKPWIERERERGKKKGRPRAAQARDGKRERGRVVGGGEGKVGERERLRCVYSDSTRSLAKVQGEKERKM